MAELEAASRRLLERPVRPPKSLDALRRRARSRQRRRRLDTAVGALVVVVAAAVGLTVWAEPHSPHQRLDVTGPSPPPTADAAPSGGTRVSYGNVSIVVPASWTIVAPSTSPCFHTNNVVLLGSTSGDYAACTGILPPRSSFASLTPLPAHLSDGLPTMVNGYAVIELAPTSLSAITAYAFPQLGVILEVEGPLSRNIVESIGPSASDLVLHPRNPVPAVPTTWRTALYDGITLRVPPTWPAEPPVFLGCGTTFRHPEIVQGPAPNMLCAATMTLPPANDGVWIRPDTLGPQPGERALGAGSTSVLVTPSDSNPWIHLVAASRDGNRIAIDIGLGPDATVAQRIIASISTQPGR